MRIISLHISKLLLTNDKVIINGLGYFAAAEQKAYHHPVSHDFTPKNKKLSFYLDKTVKSPLLAESLAGTSAEVKIQVFVLKVLTALKHGDDVILDNLGTLKRHEKGHVVFIQNNDIVLDKNFFGMEAFKHEAPIKEKPIVAPIVAPVEEKRKSRSFIYWFAIPGLVASLILAYIFIDFNALFGDSESVVAKVEAVVEEVDEPEFNVDTLIVAAIEDSSLVNNQIDDQNIDSAEASVEDAIVVNTMEQETPKENIEVEEVKIPAKTLAQEASGNYYIMAGCFKSSFKANRLLKELQDGEYPNASIKGKTKSGLIRVCYSNFPTKTAAENYMQQVSEKMGKELWMQKIDN